MVSAVAKIVAKIILELIKEHFEFFVGREHPGLRKRDNPEKLIAIIKPTYNAECRALYRDKIW